MTKKLSRDELEALFEECKEEIRQGTHCDAIDEVAREKGWIDPVALALSTNIPHFLAGKTMEILSMEIEEQFKSQGVTKKKRDKLVDSLYGYALIQNREDLSLGRYIRWLSNKKTYPHSTDPLLTNGAFLVNVQEVEGGEWSVLCKNWNNQFIRFRFEAGFVFQQLNREEIMVMLLSSNL